MSKYDPYGEWSEDDLLPPATETARRMGYTVQRKIGTHNILFVNRDETPVITVWSDGERDMLSFELGGPTWLVSPAAGWDPNIGDAHRVEAAMRAAIEVIQRGYNKAVWTLNGPNSRDRHSFSSHIDGEVEVRHLPTVFSAERCDKCGVEADDDNLNEVVCVS